MTPKDAVAAGSTARTLPPTSPATAQTFGWGASGYPRIVHRHPLSGRFAHRLRMKVRPGLASPVWPHVLFTAPCLQSVDHHNVGPTAVRVADGEALLRAEGDRSSDHLVHRAERETLPCSAQPSQKTKSRSTHSHPLPPASAVARPEVMRTRVIMPLLFILVSIWCWFSRTPQEVLDPDHRITSEARNGHRTSVLPAARVWISARLAAQDACASM